MSQSVTTQAPAEEAFQPGQPPAYISYLFAQDMDIDGQPLPARVQAFHSVYAWTREEIRPIMNMTPTGRPLHTLKTVVSLEALARQRKGPKGAASTKEERREEKKHELKMGERDRGEFDPT